MLRIFNLQKFLELFGKKNGINLLVLSCSFLLVRPHEKLLGLLGLLGLGLGLGITLMLTLALTLTLIALIALTIIFRGGGLTGKNLQPILINLKVLFQKQKLDWDEVIPEKFKNELQIIVYTLERKIVN